MLLCKNFFVLSSLDNIVGKVAPLMQTISANFITSLSDEIKGEIPVLMVEYDQSPDEKTMNEWNKILSSALPSKKKPQMIFTYPHFIYTSTGKIKRDQTLRQYLEKNYGKDFLSI